MYAILPVVSGPTTEAEIYERAGFGHPVARGDRPGLVVVDFSRGFTDAAFPTGSDLTGEVERTAVLARAFREGGHPVFLTVIAYQPHMRDAGAWLNKFPGARGLVMGSPAVELDPRLGVEAEDVVVTKKGPSAFFGTNLAALLAAEAVDTVVVCGATTSGCVRASVVDSVQYGFQTLVVGDCVGDRAEAPHRANLFDMAAKYADVIEQAEALAYVAGCSRRPDRTAASTP